MNYTEREIENIKQKAFDKGRIEGVVLAIIIFGAALCLALYNLK